MKIVYVQTYPIYHDHLSEDQWLQVENRDKWMPAITAEHGVETEIWAVGRSRRTVEYQWKDSTISIHIFPTSGKGAKTKFHFSDELIEYAKGLRNVHYILKGVDGGVGLRLLEKVILPSRTSFSFIIGGKCVTKYHKHAKMIFIESDFQKRLLTKPKWFFQNSVSEEKLIPLAKSVDLDIFKPTHHFKEPTFDIITLGRLIPYYKNYEAIFELSRKYTIAVIGGGPMLDEYRRKYPGIEWLGQLRHDQIPEVIQQARLFLYTSKRDYYPRAIAEAIACGMPIAAFSESISEDVVRPEFGILLDDRTYSTEIASLLGNPARLGNMSHNARLYAEANLSKTSSTPAVKEIIRRLSKDS